MMGVQRAKGQWIDPVKAIEVVYQATTYAKLAP
jgi:hypothetical protein